MRIERQDSIGYPCERTAEQECADCGAAICDLTELCALCREVHIYHAFAHWFPDGKRILFSGNEPGKGVRLYVYEPASGKSQAITPEGVNGTRFVIAPDSQWVAGIGPDQKGYLYPVAGGEPRMINGLNPGEQPITFSSDGRSLYIYQPGELPARVDRLDLQTGQRTRWKQLMPSDPAGVENIGPILLTPDAQNCVYGRMHPSRPICSSLVATRRPSQRPAYSFP